MRQRGFIIRSSFITLALTLGLWGCSSNKPKSDEAPSSSSAAVEAASAPAPEDTRADSSDEGRAFGLATINFAYNSAKLDGRAKSLLVKDAVILKSHSNAKIEIEGHCDSRGSEEFNMKLGERRASAVRKYLLTHGVSKSQLSTISYGKDRIIALGDDEASHAKNRRANFLVTSK